MHRLVIGLCLGVLMFGATANAATREVWRVSTHTMGEALQSGFNIVDTFYTPANKLVFVLQKGPEVLLCTYSETQVQECTELGRD